MPAELIQLCTVKTKRHQKNILLAIVLTSFSLKAQYNFGSLDSLFAFADRNSNTAKVSQLQSLLAKWTKVAALANTINFRDPVSFSATNNILLPVNFIPAEAFGGPSGSFRQITLGQQYVSNFNFNPQIDLINPQNWARVKSAAYSQEMTEINNSISKRSLHESIAAAYYNCLTLEDQMAVSEKNLASADSIVLIVKHKYESGIAREQDLNNARANSLLVKDKLQQVKNNREQQLNALRILCDIAPGAPLNLSNNKTFETATLKPASALEARYLQKQSQYLRSELNAGRLATLPVVSLVYYQGWQQNSNVSLFDNKASWIQSKYIGLRISMPIPPDVNRLSQNYTSKINYKIAALNAGHQQLQNDVANRNLEIDLDKSYNSFDAANQVMELKRANYGKSMNQYREGILPTDNLLTAFNDLMASELNYLSARAAYEYAVARININNSVK